MTDRILIILVSAGIALSTPGCAGSATSEGPNSQRAGQRIWAATCNRCHNLRPPRQFASEDWPLIVDHMRTRADLTRSEAEAVASYLRRLAARDR